MITAPSTLSLVAAVIYLVVAGAAMAAWLAAGRRLQVDWHRVAWGIIAVLFVGFAVTRFIGLEDWLRNDLRMMLYADQTYEERRSFQKPLFAIVFMVATAIAGALIYILARGVRGRRNIAAVVAIGCTGGLVFLLALRLVSLHSVDALLYGRFKLNWFADLGMTAAVFVCAVRYWLVVRGGRQD